jgi:2-hydroxy-3-oxopropionate reductase
MSHTIGFIGLGLMGRPMAMNLLKAGYPLVVHSRSQGPVDDLAAAGATRAASPADVARQATRIITMLPDSPDVELVLAGPDGVFESLQPGTVVIDMSSIAPATATRLADRARTLGATMLDAPVSGGDIGAINGTLSIMVGGDAQAFAAVKPILDVMGNPERVVHVGDAGAGQLCKLCNQMVIGGTLAVVAEAFALARRAGVDATKVREALLGGFAQSRVLDVHGDRLLKGTFTPGFYTKLYAKDMRNVVATLAEYQTAAPVSALVEQLVNATMAAGRGNDDTSIVGKTVMEIAGVRD